MFRKLDRAAAVAVVLCFAWAAVLTPALAASEETADAFEVAQTTFDDAQDSVEITTTTTESSSASHSSRSTHSANHTQKRKSSAVLRNVKRACGLIIVHSQKI